MKRRLSKAEFDALPDALKTHYKVDGTNADIYLLQIDGEDDPAELRRARDREKQAAKDEKDRADALQLKLDEISNGDARKKGDIDAIERSWKQKVVDAETKGEKAIKELKTQVQRLLVDNVANKIASEIAGDNAEIILPHISKRLVVEYDGDVPKTRILDAEGKPSAASVDELTKEFVANKKFSSIIIASKASGGANSERNSNHSAVPNGKKFNELNDRERKEWYERDPQGFQQASDENRLAQRRF